eukprot:GILK01010781.1.p1 GENE.GILK01010781.1~~GILK01010781.1.p1  ORF type:complete len:587 (+),score=83.73 GILK01010781.1:230-1762(+)
MDADNNGNITLDELINFVSKKSKGHVDRQFCIQLFNSLDADEDQRISLDEFLVSYARKEEEVKSRIEALKADIQDKQRQKEQVEEALQKAEGQEQLNAHGIMMGSQLTVQVIEATGLLSTDEGGSMDPYVLLSCERQSIETKVCWKEENPVWNEAFGFNITEGRSYLQVVVMNKDKFGSDEFIGQVAIPLSELKDQLKHDEWHVLQGKQVSDGDKGSIRLALQWIHSNVAYLRAIMDQWDDAILADQEDIKKFQTELAKLQAPFGYFDAQLWMSQTEQSVSLVLDNVAIKLRISNITKFTFVLIFAFLALACLSSMCRSDMLNLTVGMGALFVVSGNKFTPNVWKALCIGLVLTEIFDIVWFSIYTKSWGSDLSEAPDLSGAEIKALRFSLICAFINFFLKIPLLLASWKCFINAKSGRSRQQAQAQLQTGAAAADSSALSDYGQRLSTMGAPLVRSGGNMSPGKRGSMLSPLGGQASPVARGETPYGGRPSLIPGRPNVGGFDSRAVGL